MGLADAEVAIDKLNGSQLDGKTITVQKVFFSLSFSYFIGLLVLYFSHVDRRHEKPLQVVIWDTKKKIFKVCHHDFHYNFFIEI
jgi:hypothetical protein